MLGSSFDSQSIQNALSFSTLMLQVGGDLKENNNNDGFNACELVLVIFDLLVKVESKVYYEVKLKALTTSNIFNVP